MKNLANLIAATALLLGYASAASAQDVVCPDDLIEVGETVGNVVVVGDCYLDSVIVLGNVIVLPGGALDSIDSVISGNFSSDSAFVVDLLHGSVGGNVQVKKTDEPSFIVRVKIGGNLQWEENSDGLLRCNTVGGNLQARKNGSLLILGNTIGENQQCDDNLNLISDGGNDNSVGGDAQGQCTVGFINQGTAGGQETGACEGGGRTTELPGPGDPGGGDPI